MVAQNFINQLKGDAYLGAECHAQWGMLPKTSQLESIFKTEQPIRCIVSYNTHVDIVRAQEGGTTIVVHDHMATICTHTGTDQTCLGQWYTLQYTLSAGDTSNKGVTAAAHV